MTDPTQSDSCDSAEQLVPERAVTITSDAWRDMVKHATEEVPRECCGLLIGTRGGVERVVRARNAHARPLTHYLIDPRDHFRAVRLARDNGQEVVGGYHSHPRSAPIPSPHDLAQAFAHFLFCIVGLTPAPTQVTAWCFEQGNFVSQRLVRLGHGQR